jgi:hypothetical protein
MHPRKKDADTEEYSMDLHGANYIRLHSNNIWNVCMLLSIPGNSTVDKNNL